MIINKDKMKKNGKYDYETIKRYARKDVKMMGECFRVISEEKPILVVFGNCQSVYLANILYKTNVIAQNYNIVFFPFIQNLTSEKETGFSSNYMQYISFFIYQNSSIDNKFSPLLATEESILPLLNPKAVKCSFPFVYFSGYFPQDIWNKRNYLEKNITPFGDINIQTLIEQGVNVEECERRLKDIDLYSREQLESNFNHTIAELQRREEKCDVIISDFIIENYQNECLFYTPSHPTTYLLIEVARRILKFAGISDYKIDSEGLPENDGVEMLIYESVKKKMNLMFQKDLFRFSGLIDKKRDTVLDYIKKYKQYNYPELQDQIRDDFRTIDISHMLSMNNNIVKMRSPQKLTLCGRIVHLSLYFNVINKCGIIAQIPKMYAPKLNYICPGCVVGCGGGGYGLFRLILMGISVFHAKMIGKEL